jgi:hypothetical protein
VDGAANPADHIDWNGEKLEKNSEMLDFSSSDIEVSFSMICREVRFCRYCGDFKWKDYAI